MCEYPAVILEKAVQYGMKSIYVVLYIYEYMYLLYNMCMLQKKHVFARIVSSRKSSYNKQKLKIKMSVFNLFSSYCV